MMSKITPVKKTSGKSDPVEQIRHAEDKAAKAIEKVKAELKQKHSKKIAELELDLEKVEKNIGAEDEKSYEAGEQKAQKEAEEKIAAAQSRAEAGQSSSEMKIDSAANEVVKKLLDYFCQKQ